MVCIREDGNDCIPPNSCFGVSWLRRSYLSDSGSDAVEGALEGFARLHSVANKDTSLLCWLAGSCRKWPLLGGILSKVPRKGRGRCYC